MDFLFHRACAHALRAFAFACAAVFCSGAFAHEGHGHGTAAPAVAGAPASPRVVATSETYQFVGIVEGEVLVIYLDRVADNSPVTTAKIELTLDGEPTKVEPNQKDNTYEATSPLLRKPGSHEVLVKLSDGSTNDLLIGALVIPAGENSAEGAGSGIWRTLPYALAKRIGLSETSAAYLVGFLLIITLLAAALRVRRKGLFLLAAALGLMIASALGLAHEGHDHGPDLSASAGNSPTRRPDGSIFLPKPTQRLLAIRTRAAVVETRTRTVRFNGRIVANPNRSGVIQSTIQGRYQAPVGGVPPLGARVKAGDLLGSVAPSFASIDSSDMAQTLGNLDQEIALNRTKLTRQEQLLKSNVVARVTVEDTRILLEGLEKRRRELLAAKVRPEELRAPVEGVIAATRVVAGQVVAQSDQLFQIIDPTSLLVEALVFDQINPDTVDEATATVGADTTIKLKFIGRSRALQQQYSIMQFHIVEAPVPLNVGAPVTVIASSGAPVTGILLPRSALAQAPNGQTVVFTQKEPEIFAPRAVRAEAFDSQNALITGGLLPGEKVVVENAPLINQVR
jgi:cobalt-zinc-cadmium efflux system membrane fusion protein